MGTTLANIHVYKQDVDTIKDLLSDEYVVKEISKDWVTVLNKSLMEKNPDKVARKLSKSVPSPLLCFLYLDDDLMALSMFKQGKRVASYAMNYGIEPYIKNCKSFVNELEYDPKSWTRLRKIFKCDDLGKKLNMLEEFFGVALYIDADFLDDGYEKFICLRNDSIYKDYEVKQKKLNRIKNRFKVTLTQEVDGKIVNINPVILFKRNEEGVYSDDNCQFYKKIGNEILPIDGFKLSLSYPPNFYYVDDDIIINSNSSFQDADGNIYNCARFKKDGTPVHAIITPETYSIQEVLNNGNIVYLTTKRNSNSKFFDHLVCYNALGKTLWSYDHRPRFTTVIGENIYAKIQNDEKKESFIKLDLDGNLISSKTIPGIRQTLQLNFINGYLFYISNEYIKDKNVCISSLIKMNESFDIVDKIVFKQSISVYERSVIDHKRNRIYYHTLDNNVVAINLDNMEYSSMNFNTELWLKYVDKNGYIYGILGSGFSTVCILDPELNFVSRHRVKGIIHGFYESNTGTHVIANSNVDFIWGDEEGECLVRIYRFDRV